VVRIGTTKTGGGAASYHCTLRCIRIPRPAHFRAARAPLAFAFVIALGAVVVPAGPAVRPAAATIRTTMTTVDAADLSPATAETTLVAMINADRAAVGLAPLRVDARLSAIAHERSASMAAAGQLSHVQPDGRTMTDLIQAAGITWYSIGETIGWNNYPKLGDSMRIVNQGWMGSPEHTAIINSTAYNYFGLGLAISPSGDRYWTAIFLRGPDLTPPWAKMGAPATGSFVTLASRGQALRVTWTWSGADRPLAALTAGLRSFDVQRQVDGGAWVFVRTSTTSSSWSTSIPVGHRMAVRVRARDRAGNVGNWSAPASESA
jgi:uncharacterized protein YkwD